VLVSRYGLLRQIPTVDDRLPLAPEELEHVSQAGEHVAAHVARVTQVAGPCDDVERTHVARAARTPKVPIEPVVAKHGDGMAIDLAPEPLELLLKVFSHRSRCLVAFLSRSPERPDRLVDF
jgi:hypothetical protein